MAEEPKKDDPKVEVPQSLLTQMQEQMADMERKIENEAAARAGLEAMLEKNASTNDEPKLREKKNFEPKFRTVRIRKYPRMGDVTNLGYIIGWTNRGAYQEVDRNGVAPAMVDYLDVIFLGDERTEDGKLKAEKIRLLDLMNNGQQVHCKILDKKVESRIEPTGEEIDVTTFDPQHGLIATGDKIDGFTAYSDVQYKIQIPGVSEPVWVDGLYVNA